MSKILLWSKKNYKHIFGAIFYSMLLFNFCMIMFPQTLGNYNGTYVGRTSDQELSVTFDGDYLILKKEDRVINSKFSYTTNTEAYDYEFSYGAITFTDTETDKSELIITYSIYDVMYVDGDQLIHMYCVPKIIIQVIVSIATVVSFYFCFIHREFRKSKNDF